MSDTHPTLLMRHGICWMSDPRYRLAWLAGPQIAALVAIGLVLLIGRQPEPLTHPATWAHGRVLSDEDRSLVILRDRARTDAISAGTLEAKANSGSTFAQFLMGTLNDPSLIGAAATVDKTNMALDWYRKAADGGNIPAAFNVGNLMIHGRFGIATNYSEGSRYLTKAAPGSPAAQRELGLMLHNGWGMPADPVKGMQLLRAAAERGDGIAARIYGQALDNGTDGLAVNHDEAQRWLRRAQMAALPARPPGVMPAAAGAGQANH